jgi:threonylcarbamoyladenosine tRNA methylthiotransferase MtaB
LFEHQDKQGIMEGYTDNYIRISLPFDESKVNEIIEVAI